MSEKLFYHAVGHAPEDFQAIPEGDYTLQLGVSYSRSEAEKVIYQLKQSGVDAFYTPMILEDRMVYKIRSGWFMTQSEAQDFSHKLPSHLNGKVTRLY
ncbi:MAG: SPOR domain-containing protein [Oligoflexales bacterium]